MQSGVGKTSWTHWASALLFSVVACGQGQMDVWSDALTVVVSPSVMTLSVGQSITLTVVATTEASGRVVPDSVVWKSSDTASAVIARDGAVRAVRAPAQVTILATVFRGRMQGAGTATVSIPVYPAPGPQGAP